VVWDKEWPKYKIKSLDSPKLEEEMAQINSYFEMPKQPPIWTGLDIAIGEKTVLTTVVDGIIWHEEIKIEKVYNNLKPTHDPYTNPNAILYHECGCGAILDPGTKSFAALNNAASNEGWKIRWKANGDGYKAFCAECSLANNIGD